MHHACVGANTLQGRHIRDPTGREQQHLDKATRSTVILPHRVFGWLPAGTLRRRASRFPTTQRQRKNVAVTYLRPYWNVSLPALRKRYTRVNARRELVPKKILPKENVEIQNDSRVVGHCRSVE